MKINNEIAAVIALALHMYSATSTHDIEPDAITFEPVKSDWGQKFLTFRKLPKR